MKLELPITCGGRIIALALMTQLGTGLAADRPAVSSAAQIQAPSPAGAAHSKNAYMNGASVRPAGTVAGDFLALGGRVVVDQEIKGDVMAVGGSVDLRAPVGDDVRAFAGDVSVESSIGGELNVRAGNINLLKSAHIGQSAALMGGKVLIDGRIDGPLKVRAQEIILNGQVNGDARLDAESIELGPQAKLAGSLTYSARQELSQAGGAVILGTLTRDPEAMGQRGWRGRQGHDDERGWERHMAWEGPAWIGALFTFVALLACAAFLLLVFPRYSCRAAALVEDEPGLAMVIGFATLIGLPVLAMLLLITILGIPLALALLALYPAALLTGYLIGVLFLADRARQVFHKSALVPKPPNFAAQMGSIALALLLLFLLAQLPYLGALLLFFITMTGAGACVLELYRGRKSGPSSPAQGQDSDIKGGDVVHSTG
jgi:cytoskeletal protein CcmA (bactofilin family)